MAKYTKSFWVGGVKGFPKVATTKLSEARTYAKIIKGTTNIKRVPILAVNYKTAPSYYDNKKNFPSMKKRQSGWI